MFTGIITHLGKVTNISDNYLELEVDKSLTEKISVGSSVSTNGICLTVVEYSDTSFRIDYMPETREKTNLKYTKRDDLINLELSSRPDTFMDGHVVQGHVDGVGEIKSITSKGNSYELKIEADHEITKYLVNKGSVAVNGISLTIIEAGDNFFTVGIIPHTWNVTMLKNVQEADKVNVEVDIMGKYIYKYISNFDIKQNTWR